MGNKYNIDLYNNLFKDFIPSKIEIYIELFGGSFGLYKHIKDRIDLSVYNELNPSIYNNYKNIANISYNENYINILNKYNKNNSFFYIDPPYHTKEHYYEYTFDNEESHIELYNNIKKIKGKFILSYNKTDFILDLYKEYDIYKYNGLSIYHQNEIIILNV